MKTHEDKARFLSFIASSLILSIGVIALSGTSASLVVSIALLISATAIIHSWATSSPLAPQSSAPMNSQRAWIHAARDHWPDIIWRSFVVVLFSTLAAALAHLSDLAKKTEEFKVSDCSMVIDSSSPESIVLRCDTPVPTHTLTDKKLYFGPPPYLPISPSYCLDAFPVHALSDQQLRRVLQERSARPPSFPLPPSSCPTPHTLLP